MECQMTTSRRGKSVKRRVFGVGDRVKFTFGVNEREVTIIEDRGEIGVGGRRIYRVSMPVDSSEPMLIEVPGEILRPA